MAMLLQVRRGRGACAGSEVESETETKRITPRNLATASLGKIVSKRKGKQASSKQGDKVTVAAKGVGSASRTNVAEVWLPLQGAGPKARALVKLQGAHGSAACRHGLNGSTTSAR